MAESGAIPEYIVVGSGAGGGTVAARLAESGKTVLLLEAGSDPALTPNLARIPDDYSVPCFHGFASENAAMSWEFFVRHYADTARQQRDDKYRATHNNKNVDGVFYPRAGTLGGCTAHNAMITVYPHNADWDAIAAATRDPSWSSDNMRRYFERLENCRHRFLWRLLSKIGINPTRHGFKGWLPTEKALPLAALGDKSLVRILGESVLAAFKALGEPLENAASLALGKGDPNDWRLVRQDATGLRYVPLATDRHGRFGTRERLLDVAKRFPDNLKIEMNALVTRVILDEDNRAVGVEYQSGAQLYRAHVNPSPATGLPRVARCSKEVILSGGAFNTPQILMLSGIGPREEMARHGIRPRVDLPGVGKNLQDRYEVGVVNRMNFDAWDILTGAKFDTTDTLYNDWKTRREGVYTTNGTVLGVIKRSLSTRKLPDLLCFALLGYFRGYYPGYSKDFATRLNCLTWAVLKAHTVNTAGEVTLRSADPRDPPNINFRYFQEGNDKAGDDLTSVVEGIKFCRRLTEPLRKEGVIAEELVPGSKLQTDEELRAFVRDNAWGHHASCTCPIGPNDPMGVLDSDFRVLHTKSLRVVDASVFPRIPGFFIVSAVYMIGEKAAEVILADAEG